MTTASRAYETIFAGLPRERASLLPGLHRAVHDEGYVSADAMRALANHIRVPAVEVHAAASTYNELRFAPAPAGLTRICTGLACRLRGADGLLAGVQAAGGPVEEVACLFACGVAPVTESGSPPVMNGRVQRLHSLGEPPRAETRQTPSGRQYGADRRIALLVGGGSCGLSVGSGELYAALQRTTAGTAVDVKMTGCDGACWAQPVVRLRLSTRATHVLAVNAGAAAAPRLAAIGAAAIQGSREEVAPYHEWLAAQERRVLARCGSIDPASLDEYRAQGGYEAWALVRRMLSPASVRAIVAEAGLLGRGGAYFPVARKWQTAIESPGDVYLVVNLEEGEPGVYKDRHLCEGDPHAVVEGILIAASALQAPRIYLYINGQASLTAERIATAIAQAGEAGLMPAGVTVDLRRGAGGYVCGEESVILNSIEGYKAVPRLRPPFPAESGLWGHPTVVNNAETLAALPLIVRHGSGWFRAVGTERAPGTKLVCVSGAVSRPGLIEMPFGVPLRTIIETVAGAAAPATVAVVAGGPSGGLIPAELFDTPLQPGILDEGGAILGAGGMTVIDRSISPLEVARHLTAYNAAESCGKCTPCREGTARTETILRDTLRGKADDGGSLSNLNETIRLASLCGLGQAAPNPVTSWLRHFGREQAASPAEGRTGNQEA